MAGRGTVYIKKDLGLAFIPIPKNGSSTIRRFFFNWDPIKSGSHFNFIESTEILQGLRVVAVISDPTIRFARGIIELISRQESSSLIQTQEFISCNTHEEKIKCLLDQIEDIGFYDPHIKPQLDFISDSDGNTVENIDFWLLRDLTKKIREIDPRYNGKKEWSKGENKDPYLNSIINSTEIIERLKSLYTGDYVLYNSLLNQ